MVTLDSTFASIKTRQDVVDNTVKFYGDKASALIYADHDAMTVFRTAAQVPLIGVALQPFVDYTDDLAIRTTLKVPTSATNDTVGMCLDNKAGSVTCWSAKRSTSGWDTYKSYSLSASPTASTVLTDATALDVTINGGLNGTWVFSAKDLSADGWEVVASRYQPSDSKATKSDARFTAGTATLSVWRSAAGTSPTHTAG